MFLEFNRIIEPSKLPWLRTVTLSNKMPFEHTPWSVEIKEMALTLIHLTRICQNNPELRIRYNISTFGFIKPGADRDYSKIYHGIVISQMLREESLQHLFLVGLNISSNLEKIMSVWSQVDIWKALVHASDEEKRVRVKQIRLFPNPDIVTAQSFVASATAKPVIRRAYEQGLLPLWRATAKKWVEEGI